MIPLIARTLARPSIGQISCLKSGSSIRRPICTTKVAFNDQKRFSERHEWARIEDRKSGIATIGISQYAQNALGDVVYVQLPEINSEYKAGDEVGAVESVKAASEIYTPLSGTVKEVNSGLDDKPSLVNTSCYEDGWLFKIQMKTLDEFDSLMSQEAYDKYLKEVEPEGAEH